MTDDLLNIAADAVAIARKLGATAAEALAVDRRGTDIEIRDGAIEKLEQAEAREIGLRVFAGQSSAIISGSVLTRDAITRLAETALAMAKLAPPDPFAGIAEPDQLATSFPDLDLVSERLPSPAELEALARSAEDAALAVKGVTKSSGADASAGDRTIALAISNGFARAYRRTGVSVSVSAIAGDSTRMERDYDYSSAVHLADLESPEIVGRRAGERAAKRLHPRKVKSETLPVIFDKRVAAGLVGHLLAGINGSAIARGTSFLKDKLGQALFGPHVAIVEDPFRSRGLASRPFDGEGLAGARRNLIDAGHLTTWLLDLRSARQLGLKPAGGGARGLGSPPSPASSNVYLEAGTSSPNELLSHVNRGLYVTELIGSSINMVTGDYSRGASGFWIDNGELSFPVSEITIAGNLLDMFGSLTPADDLEFRSSVNAPTVLVEGLTLAGL
ncbi:MAG: TldD/PmbA family protein [Rhizobiales bacterium]|nr:TldD/PmbA family protein [Hyphomicrobiales bacterium]